MPWVKRRHRNDPWSDARYCPTDIDVNLIRAKMEEGDEILIVPEAVWYRKYIGIYNEES